MKKILPFFILSFLISHLSFSQAPVVEWDNTIGGGYDDKCHYIEQTTDGGYILSGWSFSNISGDKTENCLGVDDYWIAKLNAEGVLQWENTIGGSGYEFQSGYEKIIIRQTPDNGYLLGGPSQSMISGDKTQDAIGGSFDYWLLKLNFSGNIEWQKVIGGGGADYLSAIEPTPDGGFLIGGSSNSPLSADKTEPSWGGFDNWILKLDYSGNVIWQKTIGGDQDDILAGIALTPDNGSVICSRSSSNISGNKDEPSNSTDFWIVKLDESGNIQWQNTIGGLAGDYPAQIITTSDGGYLAGGFSFSGIGRDKNKAQIGFADYWLIRLDSTGNIVWQNTIGGGNYDYLFDLKETPDQTFVIAGYSNSGISGDKTEASHGDYDFWVLKINDLGNIIWQKIIGGWGGESGGTLKKTGDQGFVIGGASNSVISFEKSENPIGIYTPPASDYWIVKLSADTCLAVAEICNGIDDNCDGSIDEGFSYDTYFADADGDGFGGTEFSLDACPGSPPPSYVSNNSDCNDADSLLHNWMFYYADADGDLFGDVLSDTAICDGFPPAGYVFNSEDCDDGNIHINPVSGEVCNDIDDNCNTDVDEGLPVQTLFIDEDSDYYGNPLIDTITCQLSLAGFVENGMDCDDSNPMVFPGAPEVYNGIDDNCNQMIDEFNGIDEVVLSKLAVFPNPATDQITISFPNENSVSTECIISDLTGRIWARFEIEDQITLDISSYPAGIYFIQMEDGKNSVAQKFVKQ